MPELCRRTVGVLEAQGPESREARELLAACDSDRLRGAICELFGPCYAFDPPSGFRDMERPHEPQTKWPEPQAHVDDAYPILMPDGWAIGCFIFLTRVRSRGGAFIYFPGSPWRYRHAAVVSGGALKGIAARAEFCGSHAECIAEPGDAILFHHLMGHCGSPNIADPTTRHALLSRWHPRRRIVPGRKSFDEMTTIEKMNSSRYLAERFNDLHLPALPNPESTKRLLESGFAGDTDQLLATAIVHLDGYANLFYVNGSEPHVIHHIRSADLVNWQDSRVVISGDAAVSSLHFHQYDDEVLLAVGERETPRAVLFTSPDLINWMEIDTVTDCLVCTPWFIYAKYPSKVAGGQTLYVVAPETPHRVDCRWSNRWGEADSWTQTSVALRAPKGSSFRDITVASRYGDSHSAFVVDLEASVRWEGTRPHVVLPVDVAIADDKLEPLPHSCPTPPRQIRLFRRARSYWLVTHVREHNGRDRCFWGEIDWNESVPSLRELKTPAELDRARCIVGLA